MKKNLNVWIFSDEVLDVFTQILKYKKIHIKNDEIKINVIDLFLCSFLNHEELLIYIYDSLNTFKKTYLKSYILDVYSKDLRIPAFLNNEKEFKKMAGAVVLCLHFSTSEILKGTNIGLLNINGKSVRDRIFNKNEVQSRVKYIINLKYSKYLDEDYDKHYSDIHEFMPNLKGELKEYLYYLYWSLYEFGLRYEVPEKIPLDFITVSIIKFIEKNSLCEGLLNLQKFRDILVYKNRTPECADISWFNKNFESCFGSYNSVDILFPSIIINEKSIYLTIPDLKNLDIKDCLDDEEYYEDSEDDFLNDDNLFYEKSKNVEPNNFLEFIKKYSYVSNLTEDVNSSKKMIYGRDKEIDEVLISLSKKIKSNVILVGDAGVGKTAIVEEIVRKIKYNDEISDVFKNSIIAELSVNGIVSGTTYRGMMEEKLESLINILKKDKKNKVILFIDEIHLLVGAGTSKDSSLDIGNILKPLLARDNVKVIGATTKAEYKKYICTDSALMRRFDTVIVEEPPLNKVYPMIAEKINNLSEYHNVKITKEQAEELIKKSVKIIDRKFPDKALDAIDYCMANCSLRGFTTFNMNLLDSYIKNINNVFETKNKIGLEKV